MRGIAILRSSDPRSCITRSAPPRYDHDGHARNAYDASIKSSERAVFTRVQDHARSPEGLPPSGVWLSSRPYGWKVTLLVAAGAVCAVDSEVEVAALAANACGAT